MNASSETDEKRLTRMALVRKRFARNKLAVAGLVILVAMFVLAFVGPFFGKHSWDSLDFFSLLQPPSREHFLAPLRLEEMSMRSRSAVCRSRSSSVFWLRFFQLVWLPSPVGSQVFTVAKLIAR